MLREDEGAAVSDWTPRRIECAGGCGLWWYQARVGRPRRWCDRCYPKHKSLVNHGVGESARPLGWWRLSGAAARNEGE